MDIRAYSERTSEASRASMCESKFTSPSIKFSTAIVVVVEKDTVEVLVVVVTAESCSSAERSTVYHVRE